jgi:hypothetical protein
MGCGGFSLRQHGDVPGRCTTATCASLLATGVFINSHILVGDGASLDLEMVEARRLFLRSSRRRPLASGSAKNPRNSSEIFYHLGCYPRAELGKNWHGAQQQARCRNGRK